MQEHFVAQFKGLANCIDYVIGEVLGAVQHVTGYEKRKTRKSKEKFIAQIGAVLGGGLSPTNHFIKLIIL